jgi:hypothetical protein
MTDLQILLIIVAAAAGFWGYLELVTRVRE